LLFAGEGDTEGILETLLTYGVSVASSNLCPGDLFSGHCQFS